MIAVKNASGDLPESKVDDDLYIYLSGNHFQQNNRIITTINKVISLPSVNIYVVYKLDPIASSRDTTFTIQNALFGAMQITKNDDTSKYKYKRYGIFHEGGLFSIGNINNGKTVLIFGVHEDSVIHANNKANNIFVMGDAFVQGINDTTLYVKTLLNLVQNLYLVCIIMVMLVICLLTVDQVINEKLCLGNVSIEWTTSESEKTGVHGNIYDFLVDYKAINGVKPIYDMHRYLMIKHNISP